MSGAEVSGVVPREPSQRGMYKDIDDPGRSEESSGVDAMREGRALGVVSSSSTTPSLDRAGPARGDERSGRRGFMLLCLRFMGGG